MRSTLFCWLTVLAVGTAGCAAIGEEAARAECRKQPRWEDQRACEQNVRQTYSGYDQKREALSAGTSETAKPAASLCFVRQSTGEKVCPN
jgi:hypothetical protein